jgi:hypothetical protein
VSFSWPHAESLFICNNFLSGKLPTELGLLDLLRFQANGNSLTSSVPDELWRNSRLIELRLDSNDFEGRLSTLLGDLTDLFDLRLAENRFTGSIPNEIARLSNLSKCALRYQR